MTGTRAARLLPIALATVLLACGSGTTTSRAPGPGGSGSPPMPPSGTPVTFLVFGDPEELAAYRALVDAFHAASPGSRVHLAEASDRADLLTRLGTSFAAGNPPDVFLVNYRFYAQFAARGALEPLGPRLATSAAFAEDDLYAEALVPFRFGGIQTCLPQNVSSLVVYYNRDLFEAAGVSLPGPGWTWRQLVTLGKALTKDTDGDGMIDQYGLGVEPILIRLAPFLWSAGAELTDDPVRPTRLTLDTPPAQQVLDAFFDLRVGNGIVPSDVERESEDDESRFLNGRTAMLLDSRRATPLFRTITEFEWDVAPLPAFGSQASILHSDAYCMAAASANKDAAWRFIEFALGPEGQRIASAAGRIVPSLREVANSPAFLDPASSPANSRVWLDMIPSLRAVPAMSTWPEVEDATSPLLEQAMYGELPAAELARQLEAATRGAFARAEYGDE